MYNGGQAVLDRVLRGQVFIENWSACILGGIQTDPIRRIAADAVDDGLLQRFCYCVHGKQTDIQDRYIDEKANERYKNVFLALRTMEPHKNEDGEPLTVKMSADAQKSA